MTLNQDEKDYIKQIIALFAKCADNGCLGVKKTDNTFYYTYNYSNKSLSEKEKQVVNDMIHSLEVDLTSDTAKHIYIADNYQFHYQLSQVFYHSKINPKLIQKVITLIDNRSLYLNEYLRVYIKDIRKRNPDSIKNVVTFLDFPTYFIGTYSSLSETLRLSREQFDYYIDLVRRTLKKIPEKKEEIIQALTHTVQNSPGLTSEWVIDGFLTLFRNDPHLDNILEQTGFFKKKQLFCENTVEYSTFLIDKKNFSIQYKGKEITSISDINEEIEHHQIDFPKLFLLDITEEYYVIAVENKGVSPIEKTQRIIDLHFTHLYDSTISLNDLIFKAKMDVEMNLESNFTPKKVKNKI